MYFICFIFIYCCNKKYNTIIHLENASNHWNYCFILMLKCNGEERWNCYLNCLVLKHGTIGKKTKKNGKSKFIVFCNCNSCVNEKLCLWHLINAISHFRCSVFATFAVQWGYFCSRQEIFCVIANCYTVTYIIV